MHPVTTSKSGVALIKKFEGCHKLLSDGEVVSYRCPSGRIAIGWGHTKGVKHKTTSSLEECENYLEEDLNDVEEYIRRYVTVPLSQVQFDALVSLVFNIGKRRFKKSSLLVKLNSGLYDEIPKEFLKWNRISKNGTFIISKELTRRRSIEASLFISGVSLSDEEGADLMPQKADQRSIKPLSKSKTIAGSYLALFGTLASEVAPRLITVASYSKVIEYMFLFCTLGGILIVIYSRIKRHRENIE